MVLEERALYVLAKQVSDLGNVRRALGCGRSLDHDSLLMRVLGILAHDLDSRVSGSFTHSCKYLEALFLCALWSCAVVGVVKIQELGAVRLCKRPKFIHEVPNFPAQKACRALSPAVIRNGKLMFRGA